MQNIENELKELIIDSLNLEDIKPDDIINDEPLFVDGLGLDSIDALELGIAIKKKFNVVLDGDSEETRNHFSSVKNLAAFIASQVDGGR
ncbi:MAG: phosphopantetheine-binding protein [Gammaproteobacteria bacterium]|nr:phosphopantetheine-binding protein [Gammaproteobacteria bacterium]MDH5592797.1 phosphopantetheine-binding protein [Gammaproteobacteria bacterium]